MAPIKPKSKPVKSGATSDKSSASKVAKKKHVKKTKPSAPAKKKQRVYTDEELGIPKLNMITPAGVQKPKGKKKGKVFVDDQESMMTILAMVNADKEGQIESKMMKARQMEAIREARQKEAEARQEQKRSKLEETKDSLRKRKNRKSDSELLKAQEEPEPTKPAKANKKRVSFG